MKGSSSNSGGGVSEVTALAMESQPTEVLKNICAGIFSNRLLTMMFASASYDRAWRSGCPGMGVLMCSVIPLFSIKAASFLVPNSNYV